MQPLGAYIMAFAAMLFSGLSALALFAAVRRFDPPEAPPVEREVREVREPIAV